MEKKFKKIMSVVGSMFMVGATIGMAAAAGGAFPSPFVKDSNADYAIVYGANAAASDVTGANSLNTYLNTFYSSDITDTTKTVVTGDFSSSVSITNDEIELGSNTIIGSDLRTTIEDNKLSTLLDTKVSWDNGDGTDSYDIHEEILLTNDGGDSKLKVVTNLDHSNGEDLDSYVVLQNDKSLRYRLVVDDLLEFSDDDKEDAKDLMVTILGKEYGITDFEDDFSEITISLSEEKVVKKGTVLNIEGVTLTIGDIFYENIEINGVLIKEDATKRINGIEVQVINIAEHSDSSLSKALIKVGKDIERTVQNGDEYIKGDETWEWDIGIDNGKQYIGVKYTLSNVAYDEDEPEENPISVGQSYVFPENYAAISFDELTDVTYQDFDLSFDDRDLYSGDSETKQDNINIAILKGEEDDSITLMYGSYEVETDSLYFKYMPKVDAVIGNLSFDLYGQLYSAVVVTESDLYDVKVIPGIDEVTYVVDFPEEATEVDVEISREGGDNYHIKYRNGAGFYYKDPSQYGDETPILGFEPFKEGSYADNVVTFTVKREIGYTQTFAANLMGNFGEEVSTYMTNNFKSEVVGYGGNYRDTGTIYHEVINIIMDVEAVPETVEVYFKDIDGDVDSDHEGRIQLAEGISDMKLVVGDTEIDVSVDAENLTLTNTNGGIISIQLGVTGDEFTHLGVTIEDAESEDIIVDGTNIGTKDYDVMDNYGTIILNPEDYADDDEVILSIPSEQVYATISVLGQGEEVVDDSTPQFGVVIVKDTEISSVSSKNLIVVGGSCVNTVAAKLLGSNVPLCGAAWIAKTNVGAGQFLIEQYTSPYDSGKVALLVAGYNAADTTAAIDNLLTV